MIEAKKSPGDDGLHAFAEYLYSLSEREDRGALAALRRSLQDPSGMAPSACPYVVPFLPKEPFLVAALFAIDGRHAGGVSIGDAYRRIQAASGGDGRDSPSIRTRFVALLDAHPEDVGEHLRHAASLARAKDVALDWEQLLRDLLRLRHPDRWIQRAWAQDFWGRTSTLEDDSSDSNLSADREANV
jgi:CRISPR system Cascade subunit CasB